MRLFIRSSKQKLYTREEVVLERKTVKATDDRNIFAENQFKQLVKKNLGVPITLFHL